MPSSSADRNLLFGILALQMDFVTRDTLVAAMHAWVLDKAKPLGLILREQGALAEDEFALLDGLVRKHLEKHNNDPQQSLAAVSSIRSVREDLQALADADVQASLMHVASAPADDDSKATSVHVGPGTMPAHARFRILRPHAKGGLGEVFVARDEELKREVALKEIQERHADHPESRARFLVEAEVTGALEHPGIVPVYGLGTYADGRPYYAMRFIKGGSLKAAIAAFHEAQKKGQPESERSLGLRGLLGRFVDVCQAIAYAHSRGVLHRDLKPGNVMVGKYGETLVVDWGLAKVLGKSDVETTEAALVSAGDSALTQAGRVLGTPAYVSPEQAAGKLDELGPTSDVYSLGATLYCLLTGQAPFTEGDVGAVLGKVQKGDFLPPRQINPHVPPALESICRKAMALRPADRYASPRELAEEIEHWLADEPVAAHREPLPARVARAARKRPALTAGVGALLVTGVIALGVSTLLIGKAQRDTTKALENLEDEQRQRALAQVHALRDAAPGAVPGILDNLAENRSGVLARLREMHEREKDSAKRARLALALLSVEPEKVRDELVEVMFKTDDPAETVLIRDALKPHAGGLTVTLWDKAGAEDDEARFRALVALAAFDPDNARWKEVASKLVGDLLDKNPLHLGTWVLALEPVSATLSAPLGTCFRDAAPENTGRRAAAAQALKLYLTSRPDAETLFELLLDADGKQFAQLRPLLDAHAEKAIERMNAELAKTPDYWKDRPLDAKWKTPDAAAVGEIEKAGGIVAERWALCQALPMGRLSAVTEAMRAAGYRPVSVRPWGQVSNLPGKKAAADGQGNGEGKDGQVGNLPPQECVVLVWTRDGRDWMLEAGLSLEALKERDRVHQMAGLIPADVAAYATKAGVRHVALWRRGEKDEKAVLYASVAAEKHKAATDVFKADGYAPARVQSSLHERATSYCGVWRKDKDKLDDENPLRINDDEGLYAGHVADGDKLLLDVSVSPASLPLPLRAVWLADLKKAIADAQKQPKEANSHFSQGVALYNLGRDAEALKAFSEYHKRSKLFWGHRFRALLHAKAGNAEQAREDLAAFAKVSTDKPLVAALTALVAVYLGEEGLKKLDVAVKAGEKDTELAYHAAAVYARASEHARARQSAWAASLLGSPSPLTLALRPRPEQQKEYADRAVELLRLAVARGYAEFATMQADADLEAIRSHPGYREILRAAGVLRRYASVWSGDATRQAEALQGLSPEAHLARCRDLRLLGYRPVALSLASLPGEKSPLAASVWHRPVALADKDALAKRQATAAATLLTLKQTEDVWPLFRHSADPTRRSYLVWHAGLMGADPKLLMARLLTEKDASARRALIVALGEYDGKQLPQTVREPLVKTLLGWYRDDADPGVHGAINWLLRHKAEGPTKRLLDWGKGEELAKIDAELAGKNPRVVGNASRGAPGACDGAGWYVNGQRQTMVMIKGPVEFPMGSPRWDADRIAEYEPRHVRRIPRSYAIAAHSVTGAQWEQFLKERPDVKYIYPKRYSFGPRGPIGSVTWYEGAQYCNWLSQKEGIPEEQWCYPKKIAEGMKPFADHLRRTGYRLPSEAEMEYACKAGSQERRYYGSSIELLPRHAHFAAVARDRAWPVGQKRPNDLGLSDAHGNVWNWCGERMRSYPQRRSQLSVIDTEDLAMVDEPNTRAFRGGSFNSRAPDVRSSFRSDARPGDTYVSVGLRVCRTLPPDFFASAQHLPESAHERSG